MIELVHEGNTPSIRFSPWAIGDVTETGEERKRTGSAPALTKPLIYGHFCTKCDNLIQAAFVTDTVVNPRDYEELNTTVDDGRGGRKIIRTGVNHRFKSKYDTTMVQRGDKISAELIRLREHFDRTPQEETWCSFCKYVAYFSFRYDLAIQKIILDFGLSTNAYNLSQGNISSIMDALVSTKHDRNAYDKIPDFTGRVPSVIIVERNTYSWILQSTLSRFYKVDMNTPTVEF